MKINKYHIVPLDGITYDIYACYTEVSGKWVIFRDESDVIVHICSCHFVKFVDLVKE